MDVDAGNVPLFEAQGRPGDGSVDGHALSGLSGEVDFLLGNGELVFHSCLFQLTSDCTAYMVFFVTVKNILLHNISDEPNIFLHG